VSTLDPAQRAPIDVSILLVEDDRGDAFLVQACLAEVDVPAEAITWSRSLGDALQALGGRPQDIVLLDLGLPDAVGIDAVRQVVAAAPDAAVIVLTGRLERGGTAALAVRAQNYLVKDTLNGELLDRSIRYALERRRVSSERLQLREANLRAAEQARLERGLLPTPLLHGGSVHATTHYQPGRDNAVLGGDFYDIVERDDGTVRAVIGDVMGHGPDEAAIGVHLRVAWRSLVLAGTADEDLFRTLTRLLDAETEPGVLRFVTACDVTLTPSGSITLRVAGHPAPLLCHGYTAQYLDLKVGPPLGLELAMLGDVSSRWPANTIEAEIGDALILYTDGLLDAHADTDLDTLGIERLVARVSTHLATREPVRAWLPAVVAAAPYESSDDVAIVALELEGEQ